VSKRETAIIKSLPSVTGDAFFGYYSKKGKKKPSDGGEDDEDDEMKSAEEEEEVEGTLYEFEREYKFNRQESAQARYVIVSLLSHPPDHRISSCFRMIVLLSLQLSTLSYKEPRQTKEAEVCRQQRFLLTLHRKETSQCGITRGRKFDTLCRGS
jgi:hypothetical protein